MLCEHSNTGIGPTLKIMTNISESRPTTQKPKRLTGILVYLANSVFRVKRMGLNAYLLAVQRDRRCSPEVAWTLGHSNARLFLITAVLFWFLLQLDHGDSVASC